MWSTPHWHLKPIKLKTGKQIIIYLQLIKKHFNNEAGAHDYFY